MYHETVVLDEDRGPTMYCWTAATIETMEKAIWDSALDPYNLLTESDARRICRDVRGLYQLCKAPITRPALAESLGEITMRLRERLAAAVKAWAGPGPVPIDASLNEDEAQQCYRNGRYDAFREVEEAIQIVRNRPEPKK